MPRKKEKKKKLSTRMSPCPPRRHAEPKPLCCSLVPPLPDDTLSCTRSDFLSEYNIHLLASQQPQPRRAGDFLFHLLLSACCWLSPLHTSRTPRRAEGCGVPGRQDPWDRNAGEFNKTCVKPLVCARAVSRGLGPHQEQGCVSIPGSVPPRAHSLAGEADRTAGSQPAPLRTKRRGGDGHRMEKRHREETSGLRNVLSGLTTLEL